MGVAEGYTWTFLGFNGFLSLSDILFSHYEALGYSQQFVSIYRLGILGKIEEDIYADWHP